VQAFRRQRPEVPHRRGRAQVRKRAGLPGADEVRELKLIADEEYRRVVADQIPIAFFGMELEREAARLALGVGCALFAGDREKQALSPAP